MKHTTGMLYDFNAENGYDRFFDHGPGAMAWTAGPPRALWFLVPGVTCPLMILTNHAPGEWTEPGDVPGWDGNLIAPTFFPSINFKGSEEEGSWHGWIRHGQLYTLKGE